MVPRHEIKKCFEMIRKFDQSSVFALKRIRIKGNYKRLKKSSNEMDFDFRSWWPDKVIDIGLDRFS